MSKHLSTKFVSLLLAIILPAASILADSGAAMLHAQGTVTVNGKQVPSSVAVFPGDKIQTEANSFANITSVGSTVVMQGNSSLTYGSNSVDVGCGQMAITSVGQHFSTHIGNLTVSSATDVSKFKISRSAGKLELESREGAITLDDGTQKNSLPAGKTITFDRPTECGTPQTAAAQPQGTKPAAYSMRTAKIGILAALATGGIVAAVVTASGNNKKCISPDGSGKCTCENAQGNNNCQ